MVKKESNKENMCSKTTANIPLKGLSGDKVSLDVTDDTDIISSSIVNENKFDFLKNVRGHCDKENTTDFKTGRTFFNKVKKKQLKDSFNSPQPSPKFRSVGRKSVELIEDSICLDNYIKTETPVNSPKTFDYAKSNSTMKRVISTLKKTPNGPLLSKSKLRNIQQWLFHNDVETIRTPPFANLSVTPVSSSKKGRGVPKPKENGDSSLDSEVEDVLKAVYGDDWMQKNVQRKCRTEPKRRTSRMLTPLTNIKKNKDEPHVRRNILSGKKLNVDSDEENIINLNSSIESGIKVINLDNSDCSENFIKRKSFISERKKKNLLNETSSLESQDVASTKKLKKNMPSASESKKLRPKVSTATKQINSAFKTPKKTFLASLSVSTPTSRCHPDAQYYKINFKSKKEELVGKLYKLYNKEVFDGKLADDMNFSWNVKLRGTAGFCHNKRITKSTGEVLRLSRIEFSTKIVDRADRLRDTMIHELCHAAAWVIDGMLDGHGAVWSSWASKAMTRFPELPCIKRCHNYDIVSKYVYRCMGCGYSIKRHSKSINTERKRCGYCYGVLELLLNKKRKGKGEVPEYDTTRTLRTPNKFALFVKENYHSVKNSNQNAKHSEIMKTLSQQYALTKNRRKSSAKSTG